MQNKVALNSKLFSCLWFVSVGITSSLYCIKDNCLSWTKHLAHNECFCSSFLQTENCTNLWCLWYFVIRISFEMPKSTWLTHPGNIDTGFCLLLLDSLFNTFPQNTVFLREEVVQKWLVESKKEFLDSSLLSIYLYRYIVHVHIYVYAYIWVCGCIYMHVYLCTYVYAYICMCLSTCVYMCICLCAYM